MKRSENVEDIYPLSPLQQGMLFHTLYDPESEVYFEQLSCVLRGPLDVGALRRAWQGVIDRHTVLRTAFFWERLAEPLQVVLRNATLPWEEMDWRGVSALEQEERLGTYLREDRSRGFELSRAPLMRLALIRLAEQRHYLVWSHHHILLDGWSVTLVMSEVFELYRAFSRGEEPPKKRSRPYGEYIAWLREQDMSEAENFWRRELKGFREPTRLTADHWPEGSAGGKESRGEQQIELPAELTAELRAVGNRHRLTLNTLVQGAWALLLGSYSGERDVLFGTVISGRPEALEDVDMMVGLFINTLPVRVRISPEASLASWLRQLQEQQVGLRQYGYSPLVKIQGWSEVPRGRPLFDSMLVFENYPGEGSSCQEDGGLECETLYFFERANYPLALFAMPDEKLLLQIDYDSYSFDAPTIERMLEHLRNLLAAFAADPERRLRDLSVLAESERQKILAEWNCTQADYPADKSIPELFQEQVERTPDAIAVRFDGEALSYRELNRRANRLARHLQRLGVGPEVLVGVCLERSTEMIVSLLGTLKAGGAYVPLDPAYPRQRISFILEEARARVLLTQKSLLERLPEREANIFCVDADWRSVAGESEENLGALAQANNPAYAIFTSGSTGHPKGVLIEHRGVCNMAWAQARCGMTRGNSRVLQFASLSFDASVFEIVMALLHGGTLCLALEGSTAGGYALFKQLREEAITNVTLPPSVLATLPSEAMPELGTVVVAGEACPRELMERWGVGRQFFNAYGPTEATVWATVAKLTAGDEKPTIGGPIDNTQIYITDSNLMPVPTAVAGEICIGGDGLARGYLNRADLTAEKFIPNPFGGRPGTRLYRTGDLARFLPGGRIDFIGRADHQVKVRGFRIELGEVEAALSECESVKQCVVVAREDAPGGGRLVAYVVARDPQVYDADELREYLRQRLPAFMVPAAFVPLESLPLTLSGKVDRRALPPPEQTGREGGAEFIAPRSPIEEVLAEIWAEVLQVERVSARDDFFELGGHSLLATQVISRVYEIFQTMLPINRMFEEPTVEDMARALLASGDRGKVERTAELLLKVAELSDEEAALLLEEKSYQHREGRPNE